ncbi:MAG TPA: FUSC family protein [Stellaceae bacterium]
MLRGIVEALSTELRSLEVRGPRGTEAVGAAMSVTLAAVAAFALHSDEPWWAAISAWMVTRSTLAVALSRGAMRLIGSAAGATIAVIFLGLFAYDQLAFCLCLFAMAWVGLFGFAKSRNGYAWLISAITGNLVMLIALDQPQTAFTTAVNRIADVTIGTTAALLVTFLLPALPNAPGSSSASSKSALPLLFWSPRHAREFEGWLRDNWPLMLHACRGGLTVMVLPLLLNWLAPLGSSTLAVTAVAVMAIPTTAVQEPNGRTVVLRAAHRLMGCAVGALVGLFCLHWVGSNFPLWLLLLMAGTWLSSQIQSGNTGIGYVGTQAGIAFLLSMIQGQGPPLSPIPGLDRFAGIMAGLSVLLVITMVISLFRLTPEPAAAARGD